MPFVDFHLHSDFSDGEQPPESIAAGLVTAGVRYAALTDHDTLESWPRFADALKKRSLVCVPGLELTTYLDGRELHLLSYGFDPQHPDLLATLLSLRQARNLEVHSIADSMRKMGANHPRNAEDEPPVSAAPTGRLETADAIALLRRAGGKIFWAHPLVFEPDLQSLEALVIRLKAFGLDGLEAYYPSFSAKQRAGLVKLAHKQNLLVSAGTDHHAVGSSIGIEMPQEDWTSFRQALFASSVFQSAPSDDGKPVSSNQPPRIPIGKPHHFRRRSYVLRIFLPTLIAIGLFLSAIWGIILPSFEQTLLDRKRELIQELTNSAWSILASYQRDEQNGLLTREEAQRLAAARIESLRYGPEGKDYFWIQDLQPHMVMHPYRPDLNGQDLSTFTDPRGVPIFVEFANLVQREGEGYVDYVWQWKDDPERLAPKESYIRGFEPWGWAIGTGLYTDDVLAEIARLERSLINASLTISGAVILLLVFVLQQSLRIERERQEVLETLRDSTERYHSLVEATTEGTLLILGGHCRYANPTFLETSGYSTRQLEFLDLHDLFPRAENLVLWERMITYGEDGDAFEGMLRTQNGSTLECVLALSPILFAGQNGLILLCRDVARQAAVRSEDILAQTAPIGIFRAKAVRRGTLLEFNSAARAFFPLEGQPALADLFSDTTEYENLLQQLAATEQVTHLVHLETTDAATRFLSLTAHIIREGDQPIISGVLQDVTTQRRHEAAREALIEKMQASLLFLHEPLARLGRDVLVCDMHTPASALARQMSERNVTAALVSSGDTTLGIVTDHDLRTRVLAENVPADAPIHTIMSSPLSKIPENALIYEALVRMEEKGVRHLAVEDRDGKIVSVVDNKSLIQFQRYGAIVLAREISRAVNTEEVAQNAARTSPLVKTLLDSSARPRHVTNMLASICATTTERLVQLSIEALGKPPAPFAFIAMGSQGRQEQTLVTDQDNGIIFAPTTDTNAESYFRVLGERVCEGLAHAGYPLCRGGVMASQPRWCRSLPDWISGFNDWIRKSEPQEIIDLSIFFDLRTVYGEADLTHELRRAIQDALTEEPACFHHLAQNALAFKPPFRLLGNIYLGGGATDTLSGTRRAGEINLKDAMMPMVGFARLYALRHQVNQTHTLERIEALTERGVILPASRDEIIAAYDFLMQLRLQNQIASIQSGQAPTNLIHPGKLGYIQQELLKQAFAQTAAVQKKISYDFLGGS
ncbi:MAG: PAS domain S-box protein [Chloroflexi bacterium]|nr:PAS domain S-box protein [Chloroflexota bacterium]